MSGATSTAGGTITFNLFSPSDATCTGLPALSQTVPVSGNGTCRTGCWLAAEMYNLGLGCLDSGDRCGEADRRRRVKKLLTALALALAAITLTAVVVVSSTTDLLPNEQHFLDASTKTYNGAKSGSALNMRALGQHDLGVRGFNGDVFVHKNVAYIGRWGFFDSSHPQFCPSGGVAVVDVEQAASPVQVSNLEVAGASHEDVVVYTAAYGPLAGHDIAAVGLQVCDVFRTDAAAAGKRGLALWEVTDPAHPVLLSVLDTGCCTRGFHELEVGDRADLGRTFVYASLPYAERAESDGVTLRDRAGRGEAWIVDVTDPGQTPRLAKGASRFPSAMA